MQTAALLLTVFFLIALDQLTKVLVVSWLQEGHAASLGVIVIRRVLNQNVYGNYFRSNTALVILLCAEALLLIALVQFGPLQGAVAPIAFGAALGGASSNILDCLWRGGVVDFIDVRFWPVFNLADIAIIAGVLIGVSSI